MKICLVNLVGGIPLGLASLAACARSAGGHDVRIVDIPKESDACIALRAELARYGADVVGVTTYTCNVEAAMSLLGEAKRLFPTIRTIAGGPHATVCPEEVAKNDHVDVVVRGEGEVTLCEVLERMAHNAPCDDVAGIAFMRNGCCVVNEMRPFVADLDDLPDPAWELLPIESYAHPVYGHPRMNEKHFVNMITTRGCPYHCLFCGAASVWGRRLRRNTPQRVVATMRILHQEYGVRSVRFVDSTFTIDRAWILELCSALGAADIDVAWEANARANTIDDVVLGALKKAKCVALNIGVESGDDEVLRINKKNQTTADVRRAFALMKKHKIFTRAFFMIGCVGETKASIRRTREFALEIDPDQVTVCAYATPYPGTEFYDLVKEEADLALVPWEDYHHSKKPIYVPKGLTIEDIEEGRRRFIEQVRPHERHRGRFAG